MKCERSRLRQNVTVCHFILLIFRHFSLFNSIILSLHRFRCSFYFIDEKVNASIKPNKGVQQKSHHHHRRTLSQSQQQQYQQKWQNKKLSCDYGTVSVAPKYAMTQPAFGSSDKLLGTKCELNNSASNDDNGDEDDQNTECGVIETNDSHRHPLNDPTVVDSTNRTASGLV